MTVTTGGIIAIIIIIIGMFHTATGTFVLGIGMFHTVGIIALGIGMFRTVSIIVPGIDMSRTVGTTVLTDTTVRIVTLTSVHIGFTGIIALFAG